MPTLETLTAYAVSIATVVAVALQLVKVGLIDPRVADSPARDALLRGLSYVLNLAMLLGFLALNHQLDTSMALTYLALALGQTGISHVAYSVLSSGGASKATILSTGSGFADRQNDVVIEPEIPPGASTVAVATGGTPAASS